MNIYLFKIYQFFKFRKIGYPESPNKILKLLMESQYWPRDKMEAYQLKELMRLLSTAERSTEYYAKIYKNLNLSLSNIEQFKSRIPLIDKKVVIENFDNIKTKHFLYKHKHATSGSTGDPLVIYISGISEAYREACRIRFRSWWGIRENDKNVYIGRSYSQTDGSFKFKIKKHLRSRYDIDIFDLNDKTIIKYYKEIEKFRPVFIRGYKSGILEFSELMEKNNLRFKNFDLKVAIVTAEKLYENERKYIEKILGCKVANEYGAVEAGLFAYECPMGSMHINEEAVFMYTNEKNEAIVTEFFNDSVPLINYKNEDIISISKNYCTCGRTSRIISSIVGRASGYIKRTNGTKVNQLILPIIFRKFFEGKFQNSVRKYKVIQKGKTFVIKIIPLENFNKECEEYIRKSMAKEIGDDIDIKIDLVDIIERDKSGKFTIFMRE